MSTLYLIRHGKTESNRKHLYCGSTDLPLCPEGIEALQGLHYDIHPDRILTSGMLRTEQTLSLLFGEVPHSPDPRFREIDFGAFEMQGYEDLKDRADYQAWISGDNHRNVPPGGESGEQMEHRVLAALEDIRSREGSTLILTHGGVIAMILSHLFPEEGRNRYQWQPEPGHGYAITDSGWVSIP